MTVRSAWNLSEVGKIGAVHHAGVDTLVAFRLGSWRFGPRQAGQSFGQVGEWVVGWYCGHLWHEGGWCERLGFMAGVRFGIGLGSGLGLVLGIGLGL